MNTVNGEQKQNGFAACFWLLFELLDCFLEKALGTQVLAKALTNVMFIICKLPHAATKTLQIRASLGESFGPQEWAP